MGLFDFIRQNDPRHITEKAFLEDVYKQSSSTRKILDELRKQGVTEAWTLKVEFFFYSNTSLKTENLASYLRNLGYEARNGSSAGDPGSFICTGWTTKMKMDKLTVNHWAEKMCAIGYNHDCEFDGWGTTPDQ